MKTSITPGDWQAVVDEKERLTEELVFVNKTLAAFQVLENHEPLLKRLREENAK